MNLIRKIGVYVRKNWLGYFLALVFVIIATCLKYLAQPNIIPADVPILYMLAIVPTAIFFGFGPSILVCILSFLAYDYFFVPPLNQIDFNFFLTPILVIFLIIGLLFSYLASNLRKKNLIAAQEIQTRIKYESELAEHKDKLEDLVQQRTLELNKTNLELQGEINKCKLVEDALRKSQKRWETTLSSIGDAVIASDPEGQVVFMNPVAEALTGWTFHGAHGRPVTEVFNIVNEETNLPVESPVSKVLRQGTVCGLANHTILLRKDGTGMPIDDSGAPIVAEDGILVGVIMVFRDITERKKVEGALRYQALLMDNVSDAIVSTSLSHNILSWNKAAERSFGWQEKEVLGKSILDVIPSEMTPAEYHNSQEQIEKSGRWEGESIHKRRDGVNVNVNCTVNQIKSSSGIPIGLVSIFHDITEQKKAVEALQQVNAFNASILANAPSPIIVLNPENLIEYINPAFEKLTGFTAAEILNNKSPFPWWPEERSTEYRQDGKNISLHIQEHTDFERFYRKKNGEPLWVKITPAEVKNKARKEFYRIFIWTDMTEYKKTEAILKDSEEKYRGLVNNIKLGIFRTQPGERGRVIEANKALEEITGYPREELLDIEVRKIYWNPSERTSFLKEIVSSDQRITQEFSFRKKDGSRIVVAITATAVKDASGNILYTDGIIEDITERQKLENEIRELYEKEKKQREMLEEEARVRGMFIDVLGHELRTPLTPILASTGMLRDLTSDKTGDIEKKLIDNIYNSADTLAKRLEELLDLARYSRGTFKLNLQPTGLDQFIRDVLTRFEPSLQTKGQKLIETIPAGLPEVNIDTSRLEQVIINLLSNASKFSPEQGTISFRVVVENNHLQIDVKDQGIGIPEKAQERLFQPYHRVEQDRQQFPGLGLGLAIARQIVEAHGGTIWVDSQIGQGSTFSFRIPLENISRK